jgi:uncharacterized protein YhbP (UPF0306 family)
MRITHVAVTDDDPVNGAAAELVAAILGPAKVVPATDATQAKVAATPAGGPHTITVGSAEQDAAIVVTRSSQKTDLPFLARAPRLASLLASVDVHALTDACIRICRARMVPLPAPLADVRARVDAHLRANNVCVLASGQNPAFRAIPIEYDWDGDTLAFMSEGGEKFARMAVQPEVSLALADRYTGFATLRGTQMDGIARLLEQGDPRVDAMLARKAIPRERLLSLPCTMVFFLVEPTRIEHIDAVYAKEHGTDARQVI